ncbi:MAG TPA: hypothetical protein VFP21_08230 [Solirubrobacterales bacterium]|nr:hypothetical protein [Solirubrobacterales bacterium]
MSDLEQEIQQILEEEARAAIAAGWAEVRDEVTAIGLTLHLEPMKMKAAPLEIHFDSDELLVCSPGRHDMICEFFSEDPEELKVQVRALVAALISGRYFERKRDGSPNIEAEWPGPDGEMQKAEQVILAISLRKEGEVRTIAYEPY